MNARLRTLNLANRRGLIVPAFVVSYYNYPSRRIGTQAFRLLYTNVMSKPE